MKVRDTGALPIYVFLEIIPNYFDSNTGKKYLLHILLLIRSPYCLKLILKLILVLYGDISIFIYEKSNNKFGNFY